MKIENGKKYFDNKKSELDDSEMNRTYNQWVEFTINAKRSNLTISDAHVSWGKFHKPGNKGKEISNSDVNNITIQKESNAKIAACGRSGSPSGTEGSFSICDRNHNKLFKVYWDCPYGAGSTKLQITDIDTESQFYEINYPDVPPRKNLGNVTLNVNYLSKVTIRANNIVLKRGETFDPLNHKEVGLKAEDEVEGDITKNIKVIDNNVKTNIVGEYEVIYEVKNSYGISERAKITVTVVKNTDPIIEANNIVLKRGETFDPLNHKEIGLKAEDEFGADITNNIKVIDNNVKTNIVGEYKVTYGVTNSQNTLFTKSIIVRVSKVYTIRLHYASTGTTKINLHSDLSNLKSTVILDKTIESKSELEKYSAFKYIDTNYVTTYITTENLSYNTITVSKPNNDNVYVYINKLEFIPVE